MFSGTNETAGKGAVPWGFELDMPFYTWASVIVDGRVVATDYAPDSGWLVATPGSKPGGTYLLGDPYPHLSMTVPDGWTGGEGVLSRGTCDGFRTCAVVRFEVIDGPEDLCSGAIKPPLGPSFDDLMTYFAGLPIIEISESADVTVDGLRGKHLQIRFSTRLRELADENRPGEMNPGTVRIGRVGSWLCRRAHRQAARGHAHGRGRHQRLDPRRRRRSRSDCVGIG